MKVKVLGNGLTWSNRAGSSFLINEEMLVDIPQGIMKSIWGKVDFQKIKYILITHFHSDHFADLHILVDKICSLPKDFKVKVIAPKNALNPLMQMYKVTSTKRYKKEINKHLQFVVLKAGNNVEVDNYKIEAFKAEHSIKDCVCYVVTDKFGKNVGFSGDTIMCDGLMKMIEKTDTIFIDTSNTDNSSRHLCVSEVVALRKKYKKKRFYSVHMIDEVYNNYKKKLLIPEIDDIIEI